MNATTNDALAKPCTAFKGNSLLAAGPLIEVALAVKDAGEPHMILAFDDATGRVVDFDLRGQSGRRRKIVGTRTAERAACS